jgi:hypothetical protein
MDVYKVAAGPPLTRLHSLCVGYGEGAGAFVLCSLSTTLPVLSLTQAGVMAPSSLPLLCSGPPPPALLGHWLFTRAIISQSMAGGTS